MRLLRHLHLCQRALTDLEDGRGPCLNSHRGGDPGWCWRHQGRMRERAAEKEMGREMEMEREPIKDRPSSSRRESRGRRKEEGGRRAGAGWTCCSSPAWALGSYPLLQSSSTSPPRPFKQAAPTEATSGTTISGDAGPYESWSWETRKRQR